MNQFERKIRQLLSGLSTHLSQWRSNSAKTTGRKQIGSAATLRREAAARAQQAAAKISDLRDTDAGKKAEAKIADLRATDTGKKAESAIADLRQREPVKKAEESARKALHDLFSSGRGSSED